MSIQPEEKPVTMFDVAVQVAVLAEKVSSLERKSNGLTGNISLVVSIIMMFFVFGSKLNWA